MGSTCINKLTLIGPADDVRDFVRRARSGEASEGEARSPLQFSAFVPIPNGERPDERSYEDERQAWGVKWGAYNEKITSSVPLRNNRAKVEYYFETAYKPPHLFLDKVSVMYRGITFFLSFGEDHPTRGRWVIAEGRTTFIVHGEDSPDYHDQESVDFIEDETERGDAFTEWQLAYCETHEQWVNDAAFASSLERAISS